MLESSPLSVSVSSSSAGEGQGRGSEQGYSVMSEEKVISSERCHYTPKRGKLPCKRFILPDDDDPMSYFCSIHQPLQGDREKCEHCGQMIRKKSTVHASKCSALALRTSKLPYYKQNCNVMVPHDTAVSSSEQCFIDELKLIEKVERCYADYAPQYMSSDLLQEELSPSPYITLNSTKATQPSHKHNLQQQAIVNCMEKYGLLNGLPAMYVEFGAGKGNLSLAIGSSTRSNASESLFICIEKSAYKHKAENNAKMKSYRARIDLCDVDLSVLCRCAASEYGHCTKDLGLKVVGVGKHVCGQATDFSLASLFNTCEKVRQEFDTEKNSSENSHRCYPKIKGVCIALCCHTLCTWQSYVGQSWIKSAMNVTEAEFDQIRKWSGFFAMDGQLISTKLHHCNDDTGCNEYRSRAVLGKKCKRLIDFGRVEYARAMGKDAHLVKFIDDSITPENIAIIIH